MIQKLTYSMSMKPKYQIFFGVDSRNLSMYYVEDHFARELLTSRLLFARLGAEVKNETGKIRTITEDEYKSFRDEIEKYAEEWYG